MRKQKSGTIFNVSSIAGRFSNPGSGYYSATKFAVEGMSYALGKEVAPLGIRVIIIEPGAFRTDFSGRSLTGTQTEISDYKETAGKRRKENDHTHGTEPGNPQKAAQAIIKVEESKEVPFRLLLGAVSGACRVVVNETIYGNTQYIAEIIKEAAGGELFRIETVQQYPGLHKPLIEQASREKDERARLEIKTKIENPDEYDIIFIGYPNWWGNLPMPLYTIANMQKGATVVKGFTVSRNNVGSAKDDIEVWLEEIGLSIKKVIKSCKKEY
jgi:flavodoxin